jgi:hypothetical protein
LRGSPKFDRDHPVNARQYQTLAEGYALLQGVWYAASQTDYATFTCPYQRRVHAIPEPWTGQAAPVLTETDPLNTAERG